MKRFNLCLVILLLTGSTAGAMPPKCNRKYEIHYLAPNAEFYIPPSRAYILKNGRYFSLKSCDITRLFDAAVNPAKTAFNREDMLRLRILIIDPKTKKELLVTAEKKVISKDKYVAIQETIIDAILDTLREKDPSRRYRSNRPKGGGIPIEFKSSPNQLKLENMSL